MPLTPNNLPQRGRNLPSLGPIDTVSFFQCKKGSNGDLFEKGAVSALIIYLFLRVFLFRLMAMMFLIFDEIKFDFCKNLELTQVFFIFRSLFAI